MKKQNGLSLIGLLLIIGALIIAAGGVVVWEKKTTKVPPSTSPTVVPLPPTETSTAPTQPSTAQVPCQYSCPNDGFCPAVESCPHCPQYKCVKGKCQIFYSTYLESFTDSLGEKIVLSPNQTVSFKDTDLSLNLLKISASISTSCQNCLACPVTVEIEAKSGNRKERGIFQLPGFGTAESREAEWRNKEIFGYKVRVEGETPELIILTVKKL